MEATSVVLISLLAVVVSGFLARITRLPVPLVQIALGAAICQSGLSAVVLDPQVFFLLFLPPLLFLDGWRIPKDALFRDASTILKLALGLVVFTVLGMGLLIHWLIPAMPIAVAFALAAVISPTDPIAVSSIADRTPIPRRLMHILQGEALLNDATGLVCMRFAVAAVLTGSFSLPAALANFAWVAAGGLAIGAGVTWLVARIASWTSAKLGEDGGGQILVTLLIPFGVYLLAERLHCSGILAAVAAGVTMSFTDVWHWHAATRLRRTAVWDMVQLGANGSIFVLLGQQIPALIAAAPQTALATEHPNAWWLVLDVLAIVAALAVLRFVWVWASLKVRVIGARWHGRAAPPSNWRVVMVASLAGVRGAITLAGVMTLPLALNDGTPFPARDLAILLAAGVIVLSMVLATVGLPHALRGLAWAAEPAQQGDVDRARLAAAEVAIAAIQTEQRTLAEDSGHAQRHADAAHRIIDLYHQRMHRWSGDDDTPALRNQDETIERQLRLVGLRAERDEILRIGRTNELADLAVRKIVRELDHQEARHNG